MRTHPAFRAVLLAHSISIVSPGLLGVAVPVQTQMMTHSTRQVGLSVTLTGGVMSVGLVVGGVLTDHYERRKVILPVRGTCGIGFIGLCLNALLPEQSLLAIYLLSLWDGSFASLGVTALLTVIPVLVGRENLMQVGATAILAARLGSVTPPMIGGLLLAAGDAARNYGLATAGTFTILLSLLSLPALPPPPQPREHSLESLLVGFCFLLASPLVGGIVSLGSLLTMTSAVQVLYPALADSWQMSVAQIGFLYVAIPLGTAIGALASEKLAHSIRPGLLMLLSALEMFLAIGLSGLVPMWILGVVCLTLFGWLSVVSSLL